MKLKKEMKTHKLISPAKINLNLKVINFDKELKKHKLSSKVAIIKLHDVIEINQSNDLKVVYRDKNRKKIIIKNDLVKKTIKYFDKKYQKKSKFNILVKKQIPVGYGIGGGSSNAASILKFLYKFHEINLLAYFQKIRKLLYQVLE